MKPRPFRTATLLAIAVGSLFSHSGHADTFGSGENAFSIDFVPIGNPGNLDDAGAGGGIHFSPHGGVSYEYRMGTYEISGDQVRKVLGNSFLGSLGPERNVTWYEIAGFVNWLNTSTGHQPAYQLSRSFNNETTMSLWSSAEAWQAGGENRFRHKDAFYFLPSEDEWYKAAYHQNDGVTANYWDYATGSNTIPTAVAGGTSPGTAVFDDLSAVTFVTNAGGLSAYGTMGQNGNAREWLESAFDGVNDSPSEARAVLGGYWESNEVQLASSQRGFGIPTQYLDDGVSFNGFRVASVPEPSSTALLLGCGGMALVKRRRRP